MLLWSIRPCGKRDSVVSKCRVLVMRWIPGAIWSLTCSRVCRYTLDGICLEDGGGWLGPLNRLHMRMLDESVAGTVEVVFRLVETLEEELLELVTFGETANECMQHHCYHLIYEVFNLH